MSESRTSEEIINEYWADLSNWEQKTCEDLDGEGDALNQRIIQEKEAADKKLWTAFQNAAQCVAIMYKGND